MASTGAAPAKFQTGPGSDPSRPSVPPSSRKGRNWIYWVTFMTVLCLGGATLVGSSPGNNSQSAKSEAIRNSDGPFRDGLYWGKLAAQQGAAPHPSIGRWSTQSDRASFAQGYQKGYNETLAARSASVPATTQAQ